MNPVQQQRPLGELLGELASETGTLVKQEVELAKTEVSAKVSAASRDAAVIAGGAAVCLVGAFALTAALILVLALALPLWASALIVGVLAAGGGAAVVAYGIKAFKRIDPVPRETVRTIREDKQWARRELSR